MAKKQMRDKRDVGREQTIAEYDEDEKGQWQLEQMGVPARHPRRPLCLMRRFASTGDAGRPGTAADRAMAARGLHQLRDIRTTPPHRAIGRAANGAYPHQVAVLPGRGRLTAPGGDS